MEDSWPVRVTQPMTGDEILKLRERANLSQAVCARYLHLTPGYVSQLERGVKQPSGPALVLLDVIRRKGIEGFCRGFWPQFLSWRSIGHRWMPASQRTKTCFQCADLCANCRQYQAVCGGSARAADPGIACGENPQAVQMEE